MYAFASFAPPPPGHCTQLSFTEHFSSQSEGLSVQTSISFEPRSVLSFGSRLHTSAGQMTFVQSTQHGAPGGQAALTGPGVGETNSPCHATGLTSCRLG